MKISRQRIQDLVCEKYEVTMDQIKSQTRNKSLVEARYTLAWLLRHVHGDSYPEIGNFLGRTSHVSCFQGLRRFEKMMAQNPKLDNLVQSLGEELAASATA